MSGKLHFVVGPEDSEAHVGARYLGGLDEGAFRELRLARHRLHFRGRETRGFGEYGQLVAGKRLVGEDVVLKIASAIHDGRPSDLLGCMRRRGPRKSRDGRRGETQQ
jgi:hypothetical protein